MTRSAITKSVLLVLLLLLSAVSSPAADDSYQKLVEKYFQEFLTAHPSVGTFVGRHEFDGKLEDFSLAAHQAEQKSLHQYLEAFQAIDASKLSPGDRNDLELVISRLKARLLAEEQIQMWRRNPDNYSGAVTSSIFGLIKRNYAPPEVRLRAVISREEQIPAVFQNARTLLENPPQIYTEIALKQLPGIIGFFEKTVPSAFTTVKDSELQKQFSASNEKVIKALKDYQNFLKEDLLPRSHGSFAIGAENYHLKLVYEEMVDTPLDQLLEIGYAQLHKDQQALLETVKQIDANKSPQEVLSIIDKEHPSADKLLAAGQQTLDGLRQFLLDHHIVTIPGGEQARVVETPPFMRATTLASMDTPGAFEQNAREAYYNITLPDPSWPAEKQQEYLEGYNYSIVTNISVHEVWPGHYLQFLARNNNKDLSLVRKFISSGSNAEGWAHYAEQMMLDEGLENHNPKLKLAQLIDALLRDCRYIVGIQMHTKGMTMEQAVEFFVKEGYQKRVVGEIETRRGTGDPTYLIYTLGKLEILKLRDDYQKQQGKNFSLQEFHDRFIHAGAPPIKIVRREMMGTDGPML